MKRRYRFQINLLFEKCANFLSFEFMECLLSIKYVKLALNSQWILDNQQRKNSSGAIFALMYVICLCRDKRCPVCKNVFWNVIFLNVLLVLVRTFINELSKKYGTVKFDLRASLKFGFEWYTAYFSLVPRSSVPRSLFPYVPHSSSTS